MREFKYYGLLPATTLAINIRDKCWFISQEILGELSEIMKNINVDTIPQALGKVQLLERQLKSVVLMESGIMHRITKALTAERKKIDTEKKRDEDELKKLEKDFAKNIAGKQKEKKTKDTKGKKEKKEVSKDTVERIAKLHQELNDYAKEDKELKDAFDEFIDSLKKMKRDANWSDVEQSLVKDLLIERTGAGESALVREIKNTSVDVKELFQKLSSEKDLEKRVKIIEDAIEETELGTDLTYKEMTQGIEERMKRIKQALKNLENHINSIATSLEAKKSYMEKFKELEEAVEETEDIIADDHRELFENALKELNYENQKLKEAEN
ncbi:hypothetical protein ACFL0W_04745 [Nanoarchaeota archaeon]